VQVHLVKDWRDMVTEVGDHQSLVASLRQSAHAGAFQDAIAGWERRLQVLQDGLGSMAAVQRKWLYLEPVFAYGALPEHAPRFQQVRICAYFSCCVRAALVSGTGRRCSFSCAARVRSCMATPAALTLRSTHDP
jgi:Dynein heavy chain, N-terminal region 2